MTGGGLVEVEVEIEVFVSLPEIIIHMVASSSVTVSVQNLETKTNVSKS
jgi:hypothetical protein